MKAYIKAALKRRLRPPNISLPERVSKGPFS